MTTVFEGGKALKVRNDLVVQTPPNETRATIDAGRPGTRGDCLPGASLVGAVIRSRLMREGHGARVDVQTELNVTGGAAVTLLDPLCGEPEADDSGWRRRPPNGPSRIRSAERDPQRGDRGAGRPPLLTT